MKQILGFILLLCIISFNANAQFQAGTKIIGPSLSFNYTGIQETTKNSNNTGNSLYIGGSFSTINMISASSGKGVRLNLGYLNNSFKTINSATDNNRQFSFGLDLFKRKYYNLNMKSLLFYIDRTVGFNYSTTKRDNPGNPTQNEFDASLSVTPGFNYILKKNLMVDVSFTKIGSLDYNYYTTELNGIKNSTNKLSFNSELSANLLSNVAVGLRLIID
jgi:hypothetical protein